MIATIDEGHHLNILTESIGDLVASKLQFSYY